MKKSQHIDSSICHENIMYTDHTGKLPHFSSWGNRYHMIIHNIDSNSTWVEPIKDRIEGEMMIGRTHALKFMKVCGIIPKHQVLDNEESKFYKDAIRESVTTYQIIPPDDHRRNISQRAIQAHKYNFIGVLSGTEETFPMHPWCQITPHS